MAESDLIGLGEIDALLGRGTELTGKLTFSGKVRIDGKVKGEIFSDGILVLGETAEVEASVEVGTLIVKGGTLIGNVRATQLVEIHAPSRVVGDLHAPTLLIDKGARFEGRCTMAQPSGEARLPPTA